MSLAWASARAARALGFNRASRVGPLSEAGAGAMVGAGAVSFARVRGAMGLVGAVAVLAAGVSAVLMTDLVMAGAIFDAIAALVIVTLVTATADAIGTMGAIAAVTAIM